MFLQTCLIAVLIVGALWKGIDLLRGRDDRVLRHLVAMFSILAIGHIAALPASIRRIDALTQPGVGRLCTNLTIMIGLFVLIQVFTLASRAGPGRSSRRLQFGLLVLACAGLLVCMAATAPSDRAHTLFTPHIAEPSILGFYLIANAYFAYAYVYCAILAWRYATAAPRYQTLGLGLVSVGLLGSAVTSFNRGAWLTVRAIDGDLHNGFNTLNFAATNICTALIVAGLCYPAVVQAISALRSWFIHWRQHRGLATLWVLMSTAFPELTLGRQRTGSPLDRFPWPRMHARFYRRLIECRDGLVRLSPYVEEKPGQDLTKLSDADLAAHVRAALDRKPPVEDPDVTYSAKRLAVPDGDDLNAEARVLIALSRALQASRS
ncbi:MAB_1171c family putative transporter [Nocardia brasiliensis]|uniref:MAB_1171c family putative transporter n=1 Tax=Nocardia brasiliensis TaxID=37326 RepID=UPI001EEB84FE|nr:MAB_1171c family putative transporter [Nocardia brasiliensis]